MIYIYFIVYDLYYVGQNNNSETHARPIHRDGSNKNQITKLNQKKPLEFPETNENQHLWCLSEPARFKTWPSEMNKILDELKANWAIRHHRVPPFCPLAVGVLSILQFFLES
jgi:hypothetical protein